MDVWCETDTDEDDANDWLSLERLTDVDSVERVSLYLMLRGLGRGRA